MTKFTYCPQIDNNNREFIRKCYLEILNREPDEAGLNYFLNLFEAGHMNEEKLLAELRSSKEYLIIGIVGEKSPYDEKIFEIIRKRYLEILNREPNEAGLNYFLNQFKRDQMNEEKLLAELRSSKEYLDKQNYLRIIRKCYLEILNREPNEAGLNYFLNLFEAGHMNEEKLLAELRSSKEYLDKQNYLRIIRKCYLEILNREPDKAGLNYFLNLFEAGHMNEEKLLAELRSSKEYLVRNCYLEVFNSEIRADDYQYYYDMIKNKEIEKDELILIMKNTREYQRLRQDNQ